jgi:hypothetical protein
MALHHFAVVSVKIGTPMSTPLLFYNGKNKEDFCGNEE